MPLTYGFFTQLVACVQSGMIGCASSSSALGRGRASRSASADRARGWPRRACATYLRIEPAGAVVPAARREQVQERERIHVVADPARPRRCPCTRAWRLTSRNVRHSMFLSGTVRPRFCFHCACTNSATWLVVLGRVVGQLDVGDRKRRRIVLAAALPVAGLDEQLLARAPDRTDRPSAADSRGRCPRA